MQILANTLIALAAIGVSCAALYTLGRHTIDRINEARVHAKHSHDAEITRLTREWTAHLEKVDQLAAHIVHQSDQISELAAVRAEWKGMCNELHGQVLRGVIEAFRHKDATGKPS